MKRARWTGSRGRRTAPPPNALLRSCAKALESWRAAPGSPNCRTPNDRRFHLTVECRPAAALVRRAGAPARPPLSVRGGLVRRRATLDVRRKRWLARARGRTRTLGERLGTAVGRRPLLTSEPVAFSASGRGRSVRRYAAFAAAPRPPAQARQEWDERRRAGTLTHCRQQRRGLPRMDRPRESGPALLPGRGMSVCVLPIGKTPALAGASSDYLLTNGVLGMSLMSP